ncbi:MAG: MotA/TolQ/ExbB proton channel family protein [Lachnospiraceae bacterium]|nr:MotA/TolQ/ExbB proton channel family protein [Lachnospiraceae bacterium]
MSFTNVIMLLFHDGISILFNGGMIVGAFVILFNLMGMKKKIVENRDQVTSKAGYTTVVTSLDPSANMIKESKTTYATGDFNTLKKNNDQLCARYDKYAQGISIFPSIGLLGTVTGLMIQVSGSDLNQMAQGLGVALSTTFVAMVITIGLKFYMIARMSQPLNEAEVGIREYDRYRRDRLDEQAVLTQSEKSPTSKR